MITYNDMEHFQEMQQGQEALETYDDTNSYWSANEDHYATPLQMVKYFKKFTGQEGTPELYADLIMEEYQEWWEEAFCVDVFGVPNGDPEAELKELADLVYVIYGYALSRGWNLDEALYRVHVNNILRVKQPDGTVKRNEMGKILKREDAPKVRLEDLV